MISKKIISELSRNYLYKGIELAFQDFDALISSPFLEGVIKGENRGGFSGGIVHLGLFPSTKGLEKKYIIHTSLGGSSRKIRNVEKLKIIAYMVAKYVIQLLPEELRTIYVPKIRGHKVVLEYKKGEILNREIYVDYEPRHLVFQDTGIQPKQYASFLGRDIARLMFVGMTNVPRHIRPNYNNCCFKTCMIDLDSYDPNTFCWNIADLYSTKSLNYSILLEHEVAFLKKVSDYFLNALLPKKLNESKKISRELKITYLQSFFEEIKILKGNNFQQDLLIPNFL